MLRSLKQSTTVLGDQSTFTEMMQCYCAVRPIVNFLQNLIIKVPIRLECYSDILIWLENLGWGRLLITLHTIQDILFMIHRPCTQVLPQYMMSRQFIAPNVVVALKSWDELSSWEELKSKSRSDSFKLNGSHGTYTQVYSLTVVVNNYVIVTL